MARPRYSYSPEKDRNNKPKKSSRRAKPPITLPPSPTPSSPTSFQYPPFMTEEFRRQLRARQLMAIPEAPLDRMRPLSDPDLTSDMDVRDPRGYQHNQIDGPINTIFPRVYGPQPRTKVRVLPEAVVDPPSPRKLLRRKLQPIAAVSAGDRSLMNFDNQMTIVHNAIRNLRHAAETMAREISTQDPSQNHEKQSSRNIVQLISAVLEPWYMQIEDEFNRLLEGTTEGELVNSPETSPKR